MKKKYQKSFLLFAAFSLFNNISLANTNLTGIWVGNILDVSITEQETKELGDIYFSIHQAKESIVVVILSSAEKTGYLFSST